MGQLAKQRLLFICIYIYMWPIKWSKLQTTLLSCWANGNGCPWSLINERIYLDCDRSNAYAMQRMSASHRLRWMWGVLVGWCYTSPRAEASWWVWELATSSLSRRRVGTLFFSVTACRLMIHSILMWILFKMILSSLIIQWFYWWLVCPDICGTCQVHKIYASVILSGQVQFPGLFGLRWILILLGGVLGAIAACPSG